MTPTQYQLNDEWNAAYDRRIIDNLDERWPGGLTEEYHQALVEQWNGEESAWNHWGEIELAITREAERINASGTWPGLLEPGERIKLTDRAATLLSIATEHPDIAALHEVLILKATLRGLRAHRG